MLRRTNPRWGFVINRSSSAPLLIVRGWPVCQVRTWEASECEYIIDGYVLGESARFVTKFGAIVAEHCCDTLCTLLYSPLILGSSHYEKNIRLRGSCLTARGCIAFLTGATW